MGLSAMPWPAPPLEASASPTARRFLLPRSNMLSACPIALLVPSRLCGSKERRQGLDLNLLLFCPDAAAMSSPSHGASTRKLITG